MKVTKHISSIVEKTAANLATEDLDLDPYHQSIAISARILVALYGPFAKFIIYRTQFGSGTTQWSTAHGVEPYRAYNVTSEQQVNFMKEIGK